MRGSYYKDKSKYATVSGIDALNVRREPNGEVIGILHEGDTVKITEFGIGDIWANIEFNGQTAVVVSKYLKEGIL